MKLEHQIFGECIQRDIKKYYTFYDVELGSGSFGQIRLAQLKHTDLMRAIKVIKKYKVKNVQNFKNEIKIMLRLDHPHILKFYDYFEDHDNVYLVLELCTGKELFDQIIKNKFFSEKKAFALFDQMVKAIYYCHLRGVVHRDLKPENFMLISKKDRGKIKVIDFGLGRTFDPSSKKILGTKNSNISQGKKHGRKRRSKALMKTKTGTVYYIAPEVLQGKYSERCDVWSLGVILYILVCGYPPFSGDSDSEILDNIKAGELKFQSFH